MPGAVAGLLDDLLAGSRAALARVLTEVENDTPAGQVALDSLFSHSGRAHLLGVTGAPGTGKSSLVNQLARHYRQPPNGSPAQRVAVVAVDPTSPFSGGALLGDRIRMRDLAGDPGVFIRSMASRGAMGGLSRKSMAFAQVLDAAGFDVVIIETVGAGQAEVEIASLAHTVLVVETPGLGDDIQAIKAGILEIADIIVVNKADLPGADKAAHALRAMLELAQPGSAYTGKHLLQSDFEPAIVADNKGWSVPVVQTVATRPDGAAELFAAVKKHLEHLQQSGEWQQREQARLQRMLREMVRDSLEKSWRAQAADGRFEFAVQELMQRRINLNQAVNLLLSGDRKNL